jgi:predicted ester cyclase
MHHQLLASPRHTTLAGEFTMDTIESRHRQAVIRFNQEVIVQGRHDACSTLVDPDFINHSAAPGSDNGIVGMLHTFEAILRPAFPDLRVEILDQVAEGDKVVTRKRIVGTHRGPLAGIAPTGLPVGIEVIDIVRLRDGRYLEHWGVNTFASVTAWLREQARSAG